MTRPLSPPVAAAGSLTGPRPLHEDGPEFRQRFAPLLAASMPARGGGGAHALADHDSWPAVEER